MKLLFVLSLFSFQISSCVTEPSAHSATKSTRSIGNRIDTLQAEVAFIDSVSERNRDKLLVYAEMEQGNLQRVQDSVLPEEAGTIYAIVKDSTGIAIKISQIPFSESGDWYLVLSHYFNAKGHTIAFKKETNFFNSMCTEGVAYETKTEYYGSNHQLLHAGYTLQDEKGKPLIKDSCSFPYDFDYKVFPNLHQYVREYKIPDIR